MHITKFFQNFYRCRCLLWFIQIQYNYFLIDSLDVALQKYIFNISPRLNMAKMRKKGSNFMKHPLLFID